MTQQPFDAKMNSLIKMARKSAPTLTCVDIRKETTETEDAHIAKEKADADEAERRKQRKAKRESRRTQSIVMPVCMHGLDFKEFTLTVGAIRIFV